MPTETLPTPRRCRRIVEAHHLSCQGLSNQQIANRFGCARSTVYRYFSDFRRHRLHILQSVAADQLVDQVYLLTQPQTEPDLHRRHVAATRELRLLLHKLPDLQQQEQETIDDETDASAYWTYELDASGHRRYTDGPNRGQCHFTCPGCMREHYRRRSSQRDDQDEPGTTETESEQSSWELEDSGQIETNLDNSGHLDDEFPVPDSDSADPPTNFLPHRPTGPEFPASKQNPTGYIRRSGLITHDTFLPHGQPRSDRPPNWR